MPARLTARFGVRPWRRGPTLGCILGCLFSLAPAWAQEEGSSYVSPRKPSDDYLNTIDQIEAEYGPYATELADLYVGLGQSLIGSGDYEQALDAFQRGVMVVRVNSGLNSPEQTNGLFLIANMKVLLGETEAADDGLHNIYAINSDYHGENSPELIPVLERMYEWYLLTRPPDLQVVEYRDHERTVELTEKTAQLCEVARGMGDPHTTLAYRRVGEAHFQTLRFMMRREMFSAVSEGYLATREGIQLTIRDHYRAGRKAFEKYVESLLAEESTSPLEHAEALSDMADWFLVFGKAGEAWDHYEQAYQVLAQSEEYAAMADRYMGEPKPVYFFNPQPGLPEEVPPELRDTSLDISLTVTASGSARYVEILNPPEALSKNDLGDIERWVRGIRFRPAMKEGEVITIKDFIWQYPKALRGSLS
jgi:tetratricopeptide (TPR) repeat protein